MWEAFFTLMSAESAGILVLLAVIVLVWFVAALYYKWTNRLIKVEEKIVEIEGRLDRIETMLAAITLKIDNLTNSFNRLIVFLAGKFGDLDMSLYLSRSPVQLSEIGLRILEKIGGKEYIEKYQENLIAELEKFNLKTALDVQTYAPGVIFLIAERESFNYINDYVYNNPVYKEINSAGEEVQINLNFSNVTGLMGIYLRDKYLNKYPELIPMTPSSIVKVIDKF